MFYLNERQLNTFLKWIESRKLNYGMIHIEYGRCREAGEMLDKLLPDIKKIAELVKEINTTNDEQQTGSEHFIKIIKEQDNVIQ